MLLLYEGQEIYFGPTSLAASYFVRLGFVKPDTATTPDFLTSLTNPSERIVLETHRNTAPKSPDEFAQAWKQSKEADALRRDIQIFNNAHLLHHVSTKADENRVADATQSQERLWYEISQSGKI